MRKRSVKIRYFRTTAVFLILLGLLLSACGTGTKAGLPDDPDRVIAETSKYLTNKNPNPGIASVGGDWIIKGLSLSGTEVPQDYINVYYDNVRAAVKSQKGILSDNHYTEYARTIIALTSIGKDPCNVEGYDLTPYLDDAEKVMAQGINASSYALIAAKGCGMTLESEDEYIRDIMDGLSDETMKKEKAYADYVGIGLDALSFYTDREEVKAFTESMLEELSGLQKDNGSFFSVESTVEVIIALVQLGIDPVGDERFIKNGNTLGDALMYYYLGDGQFCHLEEDPKTDEFSTEKAFLALGALKSFENGGKCYT